MKRFIGILQFLTRIPININIGIDDAFYKSLVYFPLVGFVLGILYFGIGWVSLFLFNHSIAAVIILLASVILTGALHIDGVGDTFDGIYSYRDKERILEIMKDPRLGTNGLLAIVFLLLFKLAFIYQLLQTNHLWAVALMPVFGRMNSMWACYKTKTPREKGMGNLFIGKADWKMLLAATGYTLFIVFLVVCFFAGKGTNYFFAYFGLLIISLIAARLFILSIYKKIDGITGDILGAVCEMSEVVFLTGAYFISVYLIF